jgi:tRNA (mo5U34)-methyltransferase
MADRKIRTTYATPVVAALPSAGGRARRRVDDARLARESSNRNTGRVHLTVEISPMPPAAPLLPESLASAKWHHSIELPDGRVIRGEKTLEVMRRQFAMTFGPLDLRGKAVLDLGTWSGAFAVEAARRGAARVVGLDYRTWRSPKNRGREAFDFVVAASGFDIQGVELDLDASSMSLTHLGEFEVVLFLGVFYHLKDPIGALREIGKITREALVVETSINTTLPPQPPAMVFRQGAELRNAGWNWWGPNVACVEALLKTFGFERVVVTDSSVKNRSFFHAYKTPPALGADNQRATSFGERPTTESIRR